MRLRRPAVLRCLLAGSLLSCTGAVPAMAQAVYDACYVPGVGALYLINLQGLPTACLAQSHVPVSWSDGGTVADGSVTESMLAFDPATQEELDADRAAVAVTTGALEAETAALATDAAALATTGTINTPSNPVDWTRLKNVPAGFADGVDNSGGTPSDLVCDGCVGATDIADDAVATPAIADAAVTVAQLAFDPATQAELDAETAALAADGTINTPTNPVDWTQLKNVPPGFADGADDGGAASDHGTLTGLTDDDHGQYLLAGGNRTANGGFAVTGTFGQGAIAASGGGVRLLWYPRGGAFRAGAAFGTAWADVNVGDYSVAMGASPLAQGDYSVALGAAASASGDYAVALGRATVASGDSATALGSGTTASGAAATALGSGTTASASFSTAMGSGATASGTSSTALGDGTTASAAFATAIGRGTFAGGLSATAMGQETAASGLGSTALGYGADALASYSTATGLATVALGTASTTFGTFTTARARASVVLGQFNVLAGSLDVWLPADPLLVAGNGTSAAAPSNALTLFKNGNLTIAGTLTQSSDLRFKEAVEPLDASLAGVLRLRPIRYRFREGTGHPTEPRIGLGAQEVERVFPELVQRDARGYLSVAYTDMTAVLVRAVQEQQETIEALRTEVAALRAETGSLRAEVEGPAGRR